jgi:hypothetical protein
MNLSLTCHVCFSVIDADGRDLLVRELQQLRLAYQKLQDHTLTKEGEVSAVYPLSHYLSKNFVCVCGISRQLLSEYCDALLGSAFLSITLSTRTDVRC